MAIADNVTQKNKQIDLRVRKLKIIIHDGIVKVDQVPSNRNKADLLTNSIPRDVLSPMIRLWHWIATCSWHLDSYGIS